MKNQVNIDVVNNARLYEGKEFLLQETGIDKITFYYFCARYEYLFCRVF